MKGRTLRGVAFALISGICWGFSGTAGQYLFSFSPMSSGYLTTVRLLSAGVVLLALAAIKSPRAVLAPWHSGKDAARLVFFGAAGLMAVQYGYMQAIFYSNSGVATAVQYTGEAMLLIYTCVRNRRRPHLNELAAVGLALFGILLLTTHGTLSALALSPQALFWGLAAALALVVYTASPEPLIRKYGNLPITAWGMLIGGGFLTVLLRPWNLPGDSSPKALLTVVVIVLVGTVIGYSLYLESTVLIGPLKAGLIAAVETVSAPLFSWLWLKTPFQAADWAGFGCVLAMVGMISLPELEHSPQKCE